MEFLFAPRANQNGPNTRQNAHNKKDIFYADN